MKDKLKQYKQFESNVQMIGWDFSFLYDKLEEEPMPWDYKTLIEKYLTKEHTLLDIETGGGEFLLSLSHPYEKTYAIEGYEPNYKLCKERLAPLGITVKRGLGEETLRFKDNTFDIIINRHGAYIEDEVKRVLKNGGIFITQQVGSYNNKPMSDLLTPWREDDYESFTLESELKRFKEKGFTVLDSNEKKLYARYNSIEGVIFMAKIIEWEFPGFSVDLCYKALEKIDNIIQKEGYFESMEHRFMMVLQNNK